MCEREKRRPQKGNTWVWWFSDFNKDWSKNKDAAAGGITASYPVQVCRTEPPFARGGGGGFTFSQWKDALMLMYHMPENAASAKFSLTQGSKLSRTSLNSRGAQNLTEI